MVWFQIWILAPIREKIMRIQIKSKSLALKLHIICLDLEPSDCAWILICIKDMARIRIVFGRKASLPHNKKMEQFPGIPN